MHRELGPGLLESIYQDAFKIELATEGLKVVASLRVPVVYKGRQISDSLRLDLLVEDRIVVEIKSVERLPDNGHAASHCKSKTLWSLGLLISCGKGCGGRRAFVEWLSRDY